MTPLKTQPCPECGGIMCYERRDDPLAYKGQERIRKTLAWWCSKCGEAIFGGKALLARDRAFQQLKAEVDHVLGPHEVATVSGRLPAGPAHHGGPLLALGRERVAGDPGAVLEGRVEAVGEDSPAPRHVEGAGRVGGAKGLPLGKNTTTPWPDCDGLLGVVGGEAGRVATEPNRGVQPPIWQPK